MVIAFPARQHGVNSAEFIRWTKSLNVSEAKGQKFEELLKNSLQKVELDYELRVLCNDSTACLYTGLGRYKEIFVSIPGYENLISFLAEDPNTRLGLILGTGFNVSVLLPGEKWQSFSSEFGNYGENGELDDFLTCFDRILLDG